MESGIIFVKFMVQGVSFYAMILIHVWVSYTYFRAYSGKALATFIFKFESTWLACYTS